MARAKCYAIVFSLWLNNNGCQDESKWPNGYRVSDKGFSYSTESDIKCFRDVSVDRCMWFLNWCTVYSDQTSPQSTKVCITDKLRSVQECNVTYPPFWFEWGLESLKYRSKAKHQSAYSFCPKNSQKQCAHLRHNQTWCRARRENSTFYRFAVLY